MRVMKGSCLRLYTTHKLGGMLGYYSPVYKERNKLHVGILTWKPVQNWKPHLSSVQLWFVELVFLFIFGTSLTKIFMWIIFFACKHAFYTTSAVLFVTTVSFVQYKHPYPCWVFRNFPLPKNINYYRLYCECQCLNDLGG